MGNGQSIPILSRGTSTLPTADTFFSFNNILVALALVRNLAFQFINLPVTTIVLSSLML
jgi:hypothetical protein